MNILRCGTHTVASAAAAAERFGRWMDYAVVEEGRVPADLAAAWAAPGSAGRPYVVCQPASGAEVFLRFVEGDPVPDYAPIRTYGWAAMEVCIEDVAATNTRMAGSPFEVIGPPLSIPGLTTIHPMQVKGLDLEVVYLTQILTDASDSGLPKVGAPIDKPFILVMATADIGASTRWFEKTLGIAVDAPIAIRYRMISNAFGLPIETLHEIVTGRRGTDIFIEFDQYPRAATARPQVKGQLPPGVCIGTILHPGFDELKAPWLSAPAPRAGVVYGGRRVGVLKTPEGALLEVVDGG